MAVPRMSKEKLINQARTYASLAPLNSSTMESAELQYDLLKSSMLTERPWPFTVALSKEVQVTTKGEDLGYDRKYRIPVDAIGVIAINPNQRYLTNTVSSNYDLVRTGLSPGDDAPISRTTPHGDFFVKSGILHTNVEVSEILYQRDPREKEYSTDFQLSLAWALAKHFAITVSNDGQLAAFCANEAETYHTKAMRGLTRLFPTIPARMLNIWIRVYYGSLYL